jgi:hypothetical protein
VREAMPTSVTMRTCEMLIRSSAWQLLPIERMPASVSWKCTTQHVNVSITSLTINNTKLLLPLCSW